MFPFHDLAGVFNRKLQSKAHLLLSADEFIVPIATVAHLVASDILFHIFRVQSNLTRKTPFSTEHQPHKVSWRYCVECSQSKA